MQGLSKQRALDNLRARIATIEKRPVLAGTASLEAARGDFALPGGMLHEVFTDTHRNAGAMLGFALGAARGRLSSARPALLYLQLGAEAQETGMPYGAGLVSFGLDPEAVILIRTDSMVELLWAAEEALACRAVAAVVADVGRDHKGLDFTASRRLALRCTEAEGTFLLLRYGLQRTASAARLRWHLAPARSADVAFDPRAPGDSRWRLTLEKGLWQGRPHVEWLLGWTENGFDLVQNSTQQTLLPQRRFLVLFLPHWPTDCLRRHDPALAAFAAAGAL